MTCQGLGQCLGARRLLPPAFADGRFVGIRNRRYGRTVLAIYVRSPSGKLDLTPYSEEFVSLSKK